MNWRHPDLESLVEWADGQAGPRIVDHLARCRTCWEQGLRIRDSVQAARRGEIPERTLDEVLRLLHLRMSAARSGVSDVAAALEHYFGKQALRELESSTRRDASPKTLLSGATPLFHAFLGRKAADALANRLANVA